MYSGGPHCVRLSSVAQRSSIGTSCGCAFGFHPVVPWPEPHCRNPAQTVPLSSAVTKPAQGSELLLMPM